MSDFNYVPDLGSSRDPKLRVRGTHFGDGYRQRRADGLNANMENFPLIFADRPQSEINAIYDFLLGKEGVTSFTWTPPETGASEITVVCEEFNKTYDQQNGYWSVTAKFEQVPI